jgi:flavin reductase (DIM6/NTAB) family NADH-FMN oxidoreductase RutF
MSALATGVTVVASVDGSGDPFGITVNSVTSVSLDPALVLVCVDKSSNSHDAIVHSGAFALNVLSAEQEELARRFAGGRHDVRFRGLAYEDRATGSPVLEEALAWIDCTTWKTLEAGDHTVVIGEVEECAVQGGAPLLFYRGTFRRPTW